MDNKFLKYKSVRYLETITRQEEDINVIVIHKIKIKIKRDW